MPLLQPTPILVVRSDSEVADDLVLPLILSADGKKCEHSFIGGGGADFSSKTEMAPNPKDIGAKKAKAVARFPKEVQDLI